MAAHRNHPEIVELLLPYEQGLKDSEGHTAKWYAKNSSWRGDFIEVRKLLENESTERLPPPPKESVFLRTFATVGDIEGVRKYVSHAGYQDLNGMTALMLAAEKGYVDCIPLLKGELRMQNNEGETALMLAVRQGHADCIPLLEEEAGIQNNDGWTALMLAVYHRKIDCVRLLLSETGKQTTDEWFESPPGMTALMLAVHHNHPEIVELLLPYEQRLKDSNGESALILAARGGHFNCIPLLVKELGMQDKDDWTALMWAALYGKADCVRLLLSEVGRRSTKNNKIVMNGNTFIFLPRTTALMMAAHRNCPDIVQLLLPYEQGLKDSKGHTAKWYAHNSSKEGDFTRVRKLLKNEGTERLPPPPNPTEMLRFQERINELAAENDFLKKDLSSSKNTLEETKKELSQLNQENSSLRQQLQKANEENDVLHKQFEDRERQDKAQIDQLTAEVSSLKQQLDNAIDESKRHAKMNEDLQKASDQNRALINALTTEKATLQEQLSKTTEDLKRALADQKAQILVLEKENAQLRTEGHNMKDLRRRLEEVEEEKRILLQNLAAVGGRLPSAREDSSLISSAIQGDFSTLRRHLDQAGQKDSSGMTALMHAASRGQTEVVRLLRPLEARLQDGRGWTALMHAVGEGHEECVGLLLLERDLKDGEGRTAEDVANGLPDGKKKITPLLRKKVHLPDLPDELSSFQLTGRLGRGAFGTVFSAWSEDHGNCALKVVEYEEMERTIVDSLRREMGTIPSLEHPHVLRYHRVHDDPDNGTAYLVMDWCSGTLLDEVRGRGERGEPFRDDEVWRCLREMASGLAYLHERGLVHRDLKPGNVLLSSDGRCVLGDFGLARMLGDSSRTKTTAGTPLYMVPEIHREEGYDKSVDIWALGVLGYELCTGRLPFSNVIAIAVEEPPAIEDRDGGLVTLIVRMLSKDPKDRPTAREILKEAGGHE
ncbi:Kinase, NEK [Giardia muris]|uniref:Kinase, NEK n=1 Tax=Giardia muris TaxID=5742 RepID=A0A4Z1SZ61_GIAMU|nr:Kinase, NEK [Giardia muris]|eukprot:TNJ30055.1 Kinase, NEK [Giardia muris]